LASLLLGPRSRKTNEVVNDLIKQKKSSEKNQNAKILLVRACRKDAGKRSNKKIAG
jgi:hypothetical protein